MPSVHSPAGSSFSRRGFLRGAAGLSTLTSLTAVGVSCSALAPLSAPPQGDVLVWAPPLTADDRTYWTPLTARLRQKYSGLQIKVNQIAWAGRVQTLLTAVASGTPPDVAYVNRDFIPRLADDSSIVVIGDLLTSKLTSDLHPSIQPQIPYRGQIWGVPAVMSIRLPFVNTGLATEEGLGREPLPADWDGLKTWGERLTMPPLRWGLSHRWSVDTASSTLIEWIWQAGGEVIEEPDGQDALFTSEAAVEALTYVKSLFDAGYIQAADKNGQGQDFSSGRIGVLMWGSVGTPAALASAAPGLAYAVGGAVQGRRRVATGMLASYAMLRAGPNRAGAEAFVRFIAQTDSLAEIARATHFLPPVKSLSAESLWPGEAAGARMLAEVQHLRLDLQHQLARTVSRILAEEGLAALTDRKTPVQALADAAARLNEEKSR